VYASWEQLVKSIYDAAWGSPAGGADELPTVQVRVKVARTGTVLADEILKHSRIRALDQSVQEALDQVRARGLPAFPDGAKENERTLIINFIYRKPGLG